MRGSKMNLYNPQEVLDLNAFLPPDGEDDFKISYSDGDLDLDIYYEEINSEKEVYKRIRFIGTRHFFKSPFPGVSFFACKDDNNISLLHSIVEYKKSELLERDSKLIDSADFKHYRLFLHSTGVVIYVVALSLEVLE
jgi:hypothetical protein